LCATPPVVADDPSADANSLTVPVPTNQADDTLTDAPRIAADDPRLAVNPEGVKEHPLLPAIRLAQSSLSGLEAVKDYQAQLVKRERIDGRLLTQVMEMKLRESPLSVYLSFGGSHAGREVLFVQGQNGDQFWVHEGEGLKALVGTVSLAPNADEALQENRYPITLIGMRHMVQILVDQWKFESRYGEIDVKFFPQAKLNDRQCRVIQASHPQPRRQFRFHMTRLFIDNETGLPVRVEQYGFPATPDGPPPLEEEYTYSKIRTNIGLSDADFSRDNPEYSF
jgi:hypothetical protein